MLVVKRNGTTEEFDRNKIFKAALKAAIASDVEGFDRWAEIIAIDIERLLIGAETETVSVEEIQDLIEIDLYAIASAPAVAKAFILFREKRKQERDKANRYAQIIKSRAISPEESNNKANANLDENSFSGRMYEASEDLWKETALDDFMPTEIAQLHNDGELYQHDLARFALGQHNCFRRSTPFVTVDGVKTFEDFEDGDLVKVLTPLGNEKVATVRYFGVQPVYRYELGFQRQTNHIVFATENHRWILKDGTETIDLEVGDKLLKAVSPYQKLDPESMTPEECRLWAMGFGLGDGTVPTDYVKSTGGHKKANRTRIRLCGEKDNKWLWIFKKAGCNINRKYENGDQEVVVLKYHKEIPTFKSRREAQIFFEGLIAADGWRDVRSSNDIISIQTSSPEIMEFLETVPESFGLWLISVADKTGQKTNFAPNGRKLTKVYRFNPAPRSYYTVLDKRAVGEEGVWCLEVEDDKSFILTGGIATGNCLTVNMKPLLDNGFVTRHVTLRTPSKFSVACQQVAVIFQILSQHQFGGIASGHIDRDLAPYVAKSRNKLQDKYANMHGMTDAERAAYVQSDLEDELKQGAEALVHNLATLQSRPGAQLPFSSLNLGADTSEDGRLACAAILQAMINGVGPHHTTPPFPILCFQVKAGINKNVGDPNYDLKRLAIKCATMRLTPNFVNLDCSITNSDPDDPDTWLTAMGCRTQMGKDRFNTEQPYNRVGRGNLAPATIIPVAIGIKHGICQGKREKPDLDGFRRDFEYLLKKCEESLLIRANLMFKQKMKSAFEMYANPAWKCDYEYDENASVYEVLKHGTLAVGQLGWAETLVALFGAHHGESEEAKQFLLEMTKRVNEFCVEASDRNNLNFAAYYTPAENLCYTAMNKLLKRFGQIRGVTDHEFLTNSIHIPVFYDIDVFDKLKEEGNFASLATGGNICYVEFDATAVHNLEAVEQVVDFAMEQNIPYFAFNFPLDECTVCGHTGEIPAEGCPECGAPDAAINRLRRVTGYITSDYRRAFNAGKQAEVHRRTKHTKGVEVTLQ